MADRWECIVVGGGAAGLSAALVLGRARRRTLLVDAGEPSNRVAEGMGGVLGHDRRAPEELYAAGRAELEAYPSVELRPGRVVGGAARDDVFELELEDGSREVARAVLLATGMDYHPPDVDGVAERWGRSVFHCPFCHGWEVRDRPLGVLDASARAAERALLLRLWSDDVTLYTNGAAGLEAGDAARLDRAGVSVEERTVDGLRGPGDQLEAVVLAEGAERRCEALLVPAAMRQRSELARQLGARVADPDSPATEALEMDPLFRTTVPRLYAAGDVGAHAMPSVTSAIAAGSAAAKTIVFDLLTEA
ncbi:MAG TPA: NAD(P)/FAD-dependent oxidoreductase [Actinomycetota bacterium]|nr:NAD(P)/FAD-dependent oxidoreductase [Actinomycetota bacterium]